MHTTSGTMTSFEAEKNRKAFFYTASICALLLLLFFFIRWKNEPPTVPVIEDLIEINLGNDADGWGEEQPLVKGQRGPSPETEVGRKQAATKSIAAEKVIPDDFADEDAAPVTKPEKPSKSKVESNVNSPKVTTPAKPKVTYQGPGDGKGNNPNEDNGYRYQGNTPGAKGDAGSPEGDKDSYGTTPGGKLGGPKIIRGNRKIIRYYSFAGDLPKATIYAIIKVSPDGRGRFIGFDVGSTSRNQSYASAISSYLQNIQFDKASTESNVTVQFNFNVN